jgi:hypothetical protein
MNNIYVLDQEFKLQGVIDSYVSIIWRPSYSEVGDFEIYLGATAKAISLLKENSYVVRSSDISVENGVTTYEKVMIIKNVQLITDVENGDFYCVTGRELKFLLHQRIVWKQTTLTGTAENAIRRLVNENAITPTDTKRVIPDLMLGVSAGLTDIIDKQVTGKYLDESIVEICKTFNYGWDIFISNNKLVLVVYATVTLVSLESQVAEMNAEAESLQGSIEAARQENLRLEQAIDTLDTDEGVVDAARQKLGWVSVGEIVFRDMGN